MRIFQITARQFAKCGCGLVVAGRTAAVGENPLVAARVVVDRDDDASVFWNARIEDSGYEPGDRRVSLFSVIAWV
jgi:hypothetical protein